MISVFAPLTFDPVSAQLVSLDISEGFLIDRC